MIDIRCGGCYRESCVEEGVMWRFLKRNTCAKALNRNNKHWDRSNHGDHGASRGKVITIASPVCSCPPWLNLCANVVWSDLAALQRGPMIPGGWPKILAWPSFMKRR